MGLNVIMQRFINKNILNLLILINILYSFIPVLWRGAWKKVVILVICGQTSDIDCSITYFENISI